MNQANGRFSVTLEYPKGTFAYFLLDGFPFVSRPFVGPIDGVSRKGRPDGADYSRSQRKATGHLGPLPG